MTTAAEQVTIIRAGLDPSNYEAGAAAIDAANDRIIQSGERVATTDEKLARGRASAQSSFERLRRELDENARAQARYEAAQRTAHRAVELGRATQDEANRVLGLARARYDEVAQAAERRALAEAKAAEAAKGQEVERLTRSLEGYVNALDPVAASLARVTQAERDLIALRRAGGSASPDQIAAVVRMREGHEALATSSGKATNALGLQQYQVKNLTAQFVDLGVQVSSGGGILMPLIQQGPQIIDALDGPKKAIERIMGLFTPARLAALAFAGGLTAILVAAESAEARMVGLRNSLRAYTADYAALAERTDRSSAQYAARTGESRTDVRAAQTALLQADPSLSEDEVNRATDLARALAKTLDTELGPAMQRVARITAEPAAAIRDLAEKGVRGLTVELVRNVEALERQGRGAEAARVGLAALQAGLGEPEDSPMQKALKGLRSEFSNMWDAVTTGLAGPGQAFIEWLGTTLKTARETREAMARGEIGFHPIYGTTGAPGAAGTSSTGAGGGLLAIIRPTEGGRDDPYNNTQSNNRFLPNQLPLPIESMSLDAIRAVQSEMLARGAVSSSVGAYQINRDTLDDFRGRMGLSGSTVFDRATQDRIAAAIIASVGDPASPGYLDRLRGRFEGLRSVPDAAVLAAAGAPRPASQPVQVPEVVVTAPAPPSDADRDYNRRALAAGGGTLEERRRRLSDEIIGSQNLLREAQERGDQGTVTRVTDQLRDQRAALLDLRDPIQQQLKGLQDQAQASTRLEGAAGAVARQLATLGQAARDSNRELTDGDRLNAARAVLMPLERDYDRLQAQITRTTAATQKEAEAWLRGSQAGGEYAARQRAINDARAAYLESDPRFAQKVEEGTQRYLDQASAAATLATAQKTVEQSRQLQSLEAEGRLIGANADVRERELAAIKARQDLLRADPNADLESDTSRRYVSNARAIADQTRANTQLSNSWTELSRIGEQAFDRIGSAITEAFTQGGMKAVNWGNITKAVISEVVQAALRLAIINPILNAAFGGTRGTAGGILTVAGQQYAPVSEAGGAGGGNSGLMNYAGQAQQAYSTYGKISGGSSDSGPNVIQQFSPGYDWNTNSYVGGFDRTVGTGIGNWLNSPLYGAPAGQSAATALALGANSASYIAPAAGQIGTMGGMVNGVYAGSSVGTVGFGPATGAQVASMGGSGASLTPTIGGALGGAAAGIGGAYSAYQGFSRGGVGGNIQGVGGTAMAGMGAYAAIAGSMAAVPIYGWIAAAVLMIVGALLPGAKPTNGEQNVTANTLTGILDKGGQMGSKFSQANADQANSIVTALTKMAGEVGKATGMEAAPDLNFKVGAGSRDGIYFEDLSAGGGKVHRWGNDVQDGPEALARVAMQSFLMAAARQAPDENVRRVIGNSSNLNEGDPEKILADLSWYKETYQALTETGERSTQFFKAMEALNASWDAAKEKATSLGLATDVLAAKQAEAVAKSIRDRDLQLQGIGLGLNLELAQLRGGTGMEQGATIQRLQFGVQSEQRRTALEDQLVQMGATAEQVATALRTLAEITTVSGANLERNLATAAAAPRTDFWAATRQLEGRGYINDLMGLRAANDNAYNARRGAGVTDTQIEGLYAGQVRSVLSQLSAAQLRDVADSLGSVDNAAASLARAMIATTEAAETAAEREARAGTAAGVVSSLADYARGLRGGEASPLGAREQYGLASRDFQAVASAAQAGDWTSITRLQGYSDTLLSASRAVNGSGTGYVADYERIQRVFGSIADLGADRLTASVMAAELRTQTQVLNGAIVTLQGQVAALTAALLQRNATPAAAQGVAA